MAGDWRQILPVIRHGSSSDIVDATLKSSYLWQIGTRLRLTQNMRAKLRGESSQFADFLLSIGNRKTTPKTNDIFSSNFQMTFLDFVFGGIENNYTDSVWLSSRLIICATNSEVDAINNTIISWRCQSTQEQ